MLPDSSLHSRLPALPQFTVYPLACRSDRSPELSITHHPTQSNLIDVQRRDMQKDTASWSEAEMGRGLCRKKKQAEKQMYQTTSGANHVSACHPLAALIVPTFARCESFSRRGNKRAPSFCLRSETLSLMNRVSLLSLSGFLIIGLFSKAESRTLGLVSFLLWADTVGCV